MTQSEIEAFARRYGDAWANSDSDVFLSFFTEDAIYRDDQVKRLNRGHEELRAFHSHFVQAISDIRMEFPNCFGDEASLCLEWTFSGRQTGTYHGRPPTGVAFRSDGVAVIALAPDGRIRLITDYYDSAGVQRQLATE